MSYYIDKVIINKVRHIENKESQLEEDGKMRHLILTGKNGSGNKR